MTVRRYPLDALLSAAGMTERDLARKVGMDATTVNRARQHGLVEEAADRFAVRAGLEPWLVWSDWLEDVKVLCANERCGEWFVPSRKGHRFCVEACQKRAADRAYKARRRQDPEFRARERVRLVEYRTPRQRATGRAQRRAYYQRNRERELARQREYDRRKRAERREEHGRASAAVSHHSTEVAA